MNVHSFDNTWTYELPPLIIDLELKRQEIERLRQVGFSPEALISLDLLIRSFNTPANIDPCSATNVDDLLFLFSRLFRKHQKNPDIYQEVKSLLNEILIEMLTGGCPQGRSTRLYQLYLAYQSYGESSTSNVVSNESEILLDNSEGYLREE